MNAVTVHLAHRGAIILSKHLWRNEEFKRFVEKFHPNLSPTEVEALVKSEMDHLQKLIELNGTEEQKFLLDLMRSDIDARQANYWQNYLSDQINKANLSEDLSDQIDNAYNAYLSEDLKEILSEFQEIEAFSSALSNFAESNADIFSNLGGLTDEEVQIKVQQYVKQYVKSNFEQLVEADRSFTPVDIDYDAILEDAAAKLAEGKLVMVGLNDVKPLAPWHGQKGGHVVQLLDIDWEKGTVTVIDTGVRDKHGKPNGYDLEEFKETMKGGEVIFTRERAPSTARENTAEAPTAAAENTAETDAIPQASTQSESGENDVELTGLLNEHLPLDSENELDETDWVDGSETSSDGDTTDLSHFLSAKSDEGTLHQNSDGDTTDATLSHFLSAKSDEGTLHQNNIDEILEFTPELPASVYVPDNNANFVPQVSPGIEGQDDGNADVFGS